MAVYKVIQDVESEDKLLGPLSFKGLAYAAIAVFCAFINFQLFTKIHSPIVFALIFLFALPMVLFGVLASPLGREQPTEVWLLSRIRYFLKPRQRIWDQEGSNDLVTVTVPKKEDAHLTKDLSQTEVKSRLKTLASTLDTRGWAIKNVDVNLSALEENGNIVAPESDRLVKKSTGIPHQMQVVDVHAADDILDERHNPTAQKFEAMMQKAEVERKQGILDKLKGLVEPGAEPPKKHHAKSTKDLPATKSAMAKLKKSKKTEINELKQKDDEELQKKLIAARATFSSGHAPGAAASNSKHKILVDAAPAKHSAPLVKPAPNPVTPATQAVNMELAQSGNAFSVATLSQLANRQTKVEQTGPDEITISLH